MGTDFLDAMPGIALDLLIRATLLLAIAATVAAFLRRASAAHRHLVWALALAGLLTLPLLSQVTLPWSVAVSLPRVVRTALARPHMLPSPTDAATTERVPTSGSGTARPTEIPWTAIGLGVWLSGTAFVVGRLLMGMQRVQAIYRRSAAPTGELAVVVKGVLTGAFLVPYRAAPEVRVVPAENPVSAPMTWGWYRPVVLLPASAEGWTAGLVRAALLHEIGHVRRADWLVQTGICLTCALYWWHPVVWWAARRAREEAERACDDFVLNAGMPPADYAAHLVAAVREMNSGARLHEAAVAMAQPSGGGVERRVRAALSGEISRQPVTWRALAVGTGIALLILGAFVGLRPATSATPELPADARNTISIYYLSTVECQADRSRPLRLNRIGSAGDGGSLYQFFDKRTGKAFRDGMQITADFLKLAAQASAPHPSAPSASAIPAEFRRTITRTTLYLTSPQRKELEGLRTEMRSWRAVLAASPRILSAADIEPNAAATVIRVTFGRHEQREEPGVQITLTRVGTKKFGEFTSNHRNELIGAVIDPDQPDSRLQMAPNINEAITSGTLQLSGFKTQADAEAFAKHLNAR